MVFILSFYRSFSFYRLFGHRVVPLVLAARLRSLIASTSFVVSFASLVRRRDEISSRLFLSSMLSMILIAL